MIAAFVSAHLFAVGLVLGLFVGAFVGLFASALCVAAAGPDHFWGGDL